MHHNFPGLRLETAPHPIFGPLRGPRAHLRYMFHVYYSYPFYLLISPCLSTILDYRIDSAASPLNGRVTFQVHDLWPQMCTRLTFTIANATAITPSRANAYLLCSTSFLSHGRRVSLTYSNSYITRVYLVMVVQ
jgi:hypothetical protein